MIKIDDSIRILHFDLNLTQACNMRCDYCFEEKSINYFNMFEILYIRLDEMLESDHFKKNYDMVNFNFWGGEPTLKYKEIIEMVERYKFNDSVKFFIFSNGYDISGLKYLLEYLKGVTIKGNHPKLTIQISYDGYPLHNMHRKDKDGNTTSGMVLGTIQWLDKNKIPYVIKPVIRPEDFKYMPEAYRDILRLTYEDDPDFFKSQNYHPTIEYYNSEDITDEQADIYAEDLRKSLIRIASEELVRVKDLYKKPFFDWFFKSLALCSAGQHFFAIDVNGDIYPCHGCFYSKPKDHKITNISLGRMPEDLIDFSSKLRADNQCIPDECKSCETSYCMRCNVVKYDLSKKDKYIDRWRDYANQPNLCKYYKTVGKVSKVFHKVLGRK